jgi:cytochrome c
MDLSDCKACHAVEKKSIGPSYLDLGKKYKANAQTIDMLAKKIINGGGGVWGEQAMAAHPQISLGDAKEIVNYVLSLSDKKKTSKPVVMANMSLKIKERQVLIYLPLAIHG